MTNNRTSLATLVAATCFGAAGLAHAVTLGEARQVSALGEPFRAEISAPGASATEVAGCLRLAAPAGDRGLPWLREGRIDVLGSGTQARVLVSSPAAANEPALMMAIEDNCGTRLRKEYVLLLPFERDPVAAGPAPAPAVRAPRAHAPAPGFRAETSRRAVPSAGTNGRPHARPAAPAKPSAPARAVPQEPVRVAALGRSAVALGAIDTAAQEAALSAALDRSIETELALQTRIRQLEAMQGELMARGKALGQKVAFNEASGEAAFASAKPAASLAAGAARPAAPAAVAGGPTAWYGAGAMTLLGLGLLLARRRRRDAAAVPADESTMAVAHASPARADAPIEPTQMLDDPRQRIAPIEVEDDAITEQDSAIELANIMLSFGRVQGAADTLTEFIHRHPKQAVTPWLKLLEVYRAAGMRAEFEELTRRLHQTFNVREVAWEDYALSRLSPISLEALPHIMRQVARLWGTRSCQVYLQSLLRDNRGGKREGLPLAVVDDILLLSAMLDLDLGPLPLPEEQPEA